jgi:hypothetical protein
MYIEIKYNDGNFRHYDNAGATLGDLKSQWREVKSINIVRPFSTKHFRSVKNYIDYVLQAQA